MKGNWKGGPGIKSAPKEAAICKMLHLSRLPIYSHCGHNICFKKECEGVIWHSTQYF